MTADSETLRVYDARVADYAERFGRDKAQDEALLGFVAALPKGGRVLDLGCGPGNWARHLLAAGLVVDAIDASAGMVAQAAQVEGINVWQAGFDDIDAEAQYHGIWANFSLLHAPRADLPGHLARLRRALKPGGVLHIGLKEGSGEQRDSIGRFYSYYSAREITEMLAAEGMTARDIRHGADAGLDGTVAPWFTLMAHG